MLASLILAAVLGQAAKAEEPAAVPWQKAAFREWAAANREGFIAREKAPRTSKAKVYSRIVDGASNRIMKARKIGQAELWTLVMRGAREGWPTEREEDLVYARRVRDASLAQIKAEAAASRKRDEEAAFRSQAQEVAEAVSRSRFTPSLVGCGMPSFYGLCNRPVKVGSFCAEHARK